MLINLSLLILAVIQVLISGSQSKPHVLPSGHENDGSNINNTICDSPTEKIYWPHPTNCLLYIQCTPSGPVERNCAPGTAWSQSLLICNQEAKIECETNTTPTPPRNNADECFDISPNCPRNAFQCDTNSYVQERCKKTCNLPCPIEPDACVDISRHCARYAKLFSNHCQTNSYVQEQCKKTCNLCKNVNRPECPSPWVSLGGECFLLVNEVEEHRNWSAASAYCKEQATGADLAQPKDLSVLADYMLDNGHATLEWTNTSFGCIHGHNDRILYNITNFEDCKEACVGERGFICRSAEYFLPDEQCHLSYATSSHEAYEEPCASPYEEYLFAEIVFVTGYWLGGSDLATEGEWRWINGDNITTGWRKDEPNDYRSAEDCLEKRPEYGANSLNDWTCGEKASFICEQY